MGQARSTSDIRCDYLPGRRQAMHRAFAQIELQLTRGEVMSAKCNIVGGAVLACLAMLTPASAQDSGDRTVDQYQCRDVMRDSGTNRDVAIAFLHGFILGKSGRVQFNLDDLHKQTDAFIEHCLSNPSEKAVDAMTAVKR
jgi:HdeA/HdeB family